MSQVSQTLPSNKKKQKFQEKDHKKHSLEEDRFHLNKFIHNTEKAWALMVARIKRERLTALTALSRSKVMLAEMELFIAESELSNVNEKTYKKLKRSPSQDKISQSTSVQRKRSNTPSLHSRRNTASSSYSRSRSHNSNEEHTPLKSWKDFSTTPSATFSKTNSISSNDNTSSTSGSSTPVASLSSLRNKTNNSHINRSLTDSIIAEFEKPCLKIDLPEKSSANVTNYGTITQCTMSNIYTTPRRTTKLNNVKIRPVSDIAAYKKPYSQDSLSYRSHVLYAPQEYSKLSLESKEYTSQTPLKLAVSQMLPNTTPLKQAVGNRQVRKVKPKVKHSVPDSTANQTEKIHVSLPTQAVHPEHRQNVSFSTQDMSTTPSTNPEIHMPVPTPPKHIEKRQEQKHSPTNELGRHMLILNPLNNSGHMSVPVPETSTKHICVPTPPLYNHSKVPYIFGETSKTDINYSQSVMSKESFDFINKDYTTYVN